MTFATNQEKLSSSVFRSILRGLKADPQLKESLGEAIRPQPEWYLNGDPYVKGHVSSFPPNLYSLLFSRVLSCSEQEIVWMLY
jgi:cytochrome c oxidase assembly factor 1